MLNGSKSTGPKQLSHPETLDIKETTLSGNVMLLNGQIQDANDKASRILGKMLGMGNCQDEKDTDPGEPCLVHQVTNCINDQKKLLTMLDQIEKAIG